MSRPYTVEVLGFNPTERIVLGSIFNLSQRRTPRYEQYPPAVSGHPDLLLVDGGDPQFVAQAKLLAADREAPVVLVGDRDHGTGWPVVNRPLQWARLFRAFDLAVGETASTAEPQASLGQAPGGADYPQLARGGLPSGSGDATGRYSPLESAFGSRSADDRSARATTMSIRVIPGAPWVLVVDDSAPVREFMKHALAPLALNIDTADSGEKAIGMTAGRNYSCIFLDVMLPGVDGYRVCKLIKSKPTGQRSPVIMLTSKSSPFDRIRGTMAGCDSYLVKPVDEEKLRQTVMRLLQLAEGRPETAAR